MGIREFIASSGLESADHEKVASGNWEQLVGEIPAVESRPEKEMAMATGNVSATAQGELEGRARHLRFATPTAELDRRRQLARDAMRRDGIEVLLIHNHVDSLGGYVRWFSDVSAQRGYPLTVIFPADGSMTLITHGPHGGDRAVSPTDDPVLYGVERVLTTGSFQSASFTATYDGEQIAKVLKPFDTGRIGLIGLGQTPYKMLAYVKAALPNATFVDAAETIDPLKAVRSEYELEAVARTVEMQKAAFYAALDAIRPGVTEWDVATAAQRVARDAGCEHGPIMVGAAPPGEPGAFKPRRRQTRVLESGDRLTILLEPAGPDDMYAELGRTIVLGSADDKMLAEHEFAISAWKRCAAALRPGALASDVAAEYNAYLRANDRPEETRIHAHGQGYDMVERPLIRKDESMRISEGMLVAVHPQYVRNGTAYWVCDNVLVGPDGASEPLHGVEQKVFEV